MLGADLEPRHVCTNAVTFSIVPLMVVDGHSKQTKTMGTVSPGTHTALFLGSVREQTAKIPSLECRSGLGCKGIWCAWGHDALWVWKYMVINRAWGAWLLTECVGAWLPTKGRRNIWLAMEYGVVSLSYGDRGTRLPRRQRSVVTMGGQGTNECFQQSC